MFASARAPSSCKRCLQHLTCAPATSSSSYRLASTASTASASAFAAASSPLEPRPAPRRRAGGGGAAAARDELLAEKTARIAAAERSIAAAERSVAAAERSVAAAERSVAAAERELRERLAEKDAHLCDVRAHAAQLLAHAKHAADVAKGVLNVRGLFEACLAEIWRAAGPGPALSVDRTPVTARLRLLLSEGSGAGHCAGLVAYLRVAAEDNGVPEREILMQAGRLYEVLSERLHSDATSGAGTTSLPTAIFDRSGRTTMVALAAFVRFTGRSIALYDDMGGAQSLRMRQLDSPTQCGVTLEVLRKAPFAPISP